MKVMVQEHLLTFFTALGIYINNVKSIKYHYLYIHCLKRYHKAVKRLKNLNTCMFHPYQKIVLFENVIDTTN